MVVIDNLSNSSIQGLHEFISANNDEGAQRTREDRLSLHHVDIRNEDDVDRVFKREGDVDVCIHLAARISVIDSLRDPDSTFATNVKGTQNILSSASQADARSLVFASSAAVYGTPKRLPISEEDPTNPISPYGKSKLLGEQLVNKYSSKFKIATSLRIFNAYGIGQTLGYAGVITRFAHQISNHHPPIIYGDGNQTRDFVSVDDVIRSIEIAAGISDAGIKDRSLLNEFGRSNGSAFLDSNVFNVGTGIPTTISELARLMVDLMAGSDSQFLQPIHENGIEGDIRDSIADTKRSRLTLGFCFKDDVRSGLHKLFSTA